MKNNKFYGFTLSECLIALAIVGIISALTIPGVVANYQKQTYVTSLKKAYTDLQQNLTVMQTENYRNKGLYNSKLHLKNSSDSISSTAGEFLRTYYKINKDCGTDTQPCFADAYGSINNNKDESFSCSNGYSALLSNGFAICMIPATKSIKHMMGSATKPGFDLEIKNPVTVFLDTNGPSLPNIGGRDMFKFNIYEDFSIDVIPPELIQNATAETERNSLYSSNCLTSSTGEGCFGKILNDNWNMNY